MGSRKHVGVVRRPLEYVLFAVAAILIGVLLWAVTLLNSETERHTDNKTSIQQKSPLRGTIEEIGWLTESDIKEESAVDIVQRKKDQRITKNVDAAAENIGSAYDENLLSPDICAEIDKQITQYTERFSQLFATFSETESNLRMSRTEQLQNFRVEISTFRSKRDLERANSYELLRQTTHDEQLPFVSEYIIKTDEIVFLRRQDFDSARANYVTSVDNFISSRTRLVSEGSELFRNSALKALVAAKSNCRERTHDKSEIRVSLQQVLGQARLGYAEVLRIREDFDAQVQSAEADKNNSYAQATAAFEQRVKAIQEEYKTLKR